MSSPQCELAEHAVKPDLVGVLQKDFTHGIRGWVLDRNALQHSHTVSITIDNRYEFTVKADRPRSGLCDGVSGEYGFELRLFDLPETVFDSPVYKIEARVCGTGYQLSNSPMLFNPRDVALQLISLCKEDLDKLGETIHVPQSL